MVDVEVDNMANEVADMEVDKAAYIVVMVPDEDFVLYVYGQLANGDICGDEL